MDSNLKVTLKNLRDTQSIYHKINIKDIKRYIDRYIKDSTYKRSVKNKSH